MKKFMRSRTLVAAAAVAGLLGSALGGTAGARQEKSAPLKGEGVGLKIIGNVDYSGGTDMEFATIKGRDYAFAASWSALKDGGGLHVIDITNPEKVKEVAWLKCTVSQSDIQISHDNKTLLMAADGAGGPESCLMTGKAGFMTVDIRNPKKPKAIGAAQIPRGSHNVTAHPTKPYVYNSDSDVGNPQGEIQIWSIKNPKKPKLVNTAQALGHSPHDISFDKKGNRAVTAGVDNIEIYDTSDVENPSLLMTFQCPGCSITHDAKFTPDDNGLVIGDEGGGGLPYPCPGGALYFYRLENDFVPVLTGIYEPNELLIAGGADSQAGPGACTSHVFDFDEKGEHISISWYTAGTRYLNIGDGTGAALGEHAAGGITEAGWFRPDGGVSWSSKIYKNPKYVFSNDMNRGFDVFKVVGK